MSHKTDLLDPWRDGHKFIINPATSEDRLISLLTAGTANVAVIMDWDSTLTRKMPNRIDGTTWGIMRRHMTSDAKRRRHSAMFAQYGPLEADGKLTEEQSRQWQINALDLLIGASSQAIEADARNCIALRPGVKDLFALCAAYDIPTVIKSTGATLIIRAVASQQSIHPTRIFSNEFLLDDQGIITSHNRNTLVHSLNKHTLWRPWNCLPPEEQRRTLIVVGDNPHDVSMVREDLEEPNAYDCVLRIRLDGGKARLAAEGGRDAWLPYVSESFAHGFDLVAVDDSCTAIIQLLRAIVRHQ